MTEYAPIPGKASYPVWWEYAGCYYCPYRINGPFVAGRDDAAFDAARAAIQEHIKAEHPTPTKKEKGSGNG